MRYNLGLIVSIWIKGDFYGNVFNATIDSGGSWLKYFKNGSPVEWYVPASIELKVSRIDNPGIVDEWITMEEFNSMKKYFKDNFLTWIEED